MIARSPSGDQPLRTNTCTVEATTGAAAAKAASRVSGEPPALAASVETEGRCRRSRSRSRIRIRIRLSAIAGWITLRQYVAGPFGALPIGHGRLGIGARNEPRAPEQLEPMDVARTCGEDLACRHPDDQLGLGESRQQLVV